MATPVYNNERVAGYYDYQAGLCLPAEARSKPDPPDKTSAPAGGWPKKVLRAALALLFEDTGAGAAACAGKPQESCQDERPLSTTISPANPRYNYDVSDPTRPQAEWRIAGIANCDWSLEGISAAANFGPEGDETAELIPGGEVDGHPTLTAIIRHRFDQELGGRFPVTVAGKEGASDTVYIYPPFYATTGCESSQDPLIAGQIISQPETVYAGDEVVFSIPLALIRSCNEVTAREDLARFQAEFVIENVSVAAQNDGTNYYASYSFDRAGDKSYYLRITDRVFASTSQLFPRSLYVGENTCSTVSDIGPITRNPDLSEMVRGSDTTFTWTVENLTDCLGGNLEPISNNADEFLGGEFSFDYDPLTATLTVTGSILPTIDGGAIRVELHDDFGNIRIINLYLPEIRNAEIIQEQANAGAPVTISLNEIPSGASSFRWSVNGVEVGTEESLTYTFADPGAAWPASVPVSVTFTTWHGEEITIDKDIEVYPPADACSAQPVFASYSRSHSGIARYSDTSVVYQLLGINECGALLSAGSVSAANLPTLVSNNIVTAFESYNPLTGNYTLSAQFIGHQNEDLGSTFNIRMVGVNSTRVQEVWFPTFEPIEIVQEQANAGVPVTIALNEIPSGASNFRWSVNGTQVGTDESLTYTFADPGAAWPASVPVSVTFTTWHGEEITIDKNIEVYPADIDLPPASITAPFSAEIGVGVAFTSPGANETLYSYTWNFGDGTPSATGASLTHSFGATGTYEVGLTVSRLDNPDIRRSVTQNITIIPHPAPNVGIVAPLSAPVNTSVSFSVPIPTTGAAYSWEFGDGGTASGTAVSHTYTTRGTYQVRLTGNNGGTINSITQFITIY